MTTTMKPVSACVCAVAAWLLASQGEARAADVLFKNAPGTTSLTNNTNWDGGALPAAARTLAWGAAVGGTRSADR
ncbi:MAG: hypothetical protein U1F87_09455 [Kiritimatiellia bacterium]